MNELDFSFEETPWERLLSSLKPGSTLSAANFLALMEGEEEQYVEDALFDMEVGRIFLDVSDLPRPAGTGEAALRLRQEEQLVKRGLCPSDLGPNDPLRLYLEELAATPVCGDEQSMAERYLNGDEDAMMMLTNLGLGRVVRTAEEYVGMGVLLMDLIQEGSLGLWQAIQNWQGGDYVAFSDRWIRFYMAKAITLQARVSGVGQKLRTALEDYRNVDEQLLSELGRNPTIEEIAQRLHMTVDATATVQKMLENARILAQAKQQPEPEEDKEAEEQAVEDTAYFQMRQRIAELLSELDETDAKLLTLRYGLEGGLPLSAEDTGKRLGLTSDEVTAHEAAALAKLRKY